MIADQDIQEQHDQAERHLSEVGQYGEARP